MGIVGLTKDPCLPKDRFITVLSPCLLAANCCQGGCAGSTDVVSGHVPISTKDRYVHEVVWLRCAFELSTWTERWVSKTYPRAPQSLQMGAICEVELERYIISPVIEGEQIRPAEDKSGYLPCCLHGCTR